MFYSQISEPQSILDRRFRLQGRKGVKPRKGQDEERGQRSSLSTSNNLLNPLNVNFLQWGHTRSPAYVISVRDPSFSNPNTQYLLLTQQCIYLLGPYFKIPSLLRIYMTSFFLFFFFVY